MIQAVIFDMDGVLLDSEKAMRKASIMALSEWGITARHEDFFPFTGAGDDRFVGGVAQQYGVAYDPAMKQRTYEIYLEICREEITRFPYIPETFQRLEKMHLKTAIASAADAVKVNANILAAGIEPDHIGTIITGDDVTRKKPDPDAFLLAAKQLGIKPCNCVVIEDAVNGIEAACRAGMKAIGIPSSFSPELLIQAGAYTIAEQTCHVPDLVAAFNQTATS